MRPLPAIEAHPRDDQWAALHRAADLVCDTWPAALSDIDVIGFPPSTMPAGRGGGDSSSVETAILNPSVAVGWVAELHDVILKVLTAAWPGSAVGIVWEPDRVRPVLHGAIDELKASGWTLDDLVDFDPRSPNHRRDVFGLERLADAAARSWPAPARTGHNVDGVTVGARGNQTEICALCELPVAGGHGDPIRRIDGQPYHGRSCWFTVHRQRTHPSTSPAPTGNA